MQGFNVKNVEIGKQKALNKEIHHKETKYAASRLVSCKQHDRKNISMKDGYDNNEAVNAHFLIQ